MTLHEKLDFFHGRARKVGIIAVVVDRVSKDLNYFFLCHIHDLVEDVEKFGTGCCSLIICGPSKAIDLVSLLWGEISEIVDLNTGIFKKRRKNSVGVILSSLLIILVLTILGRVNFSM
jgi:hypothetical protein